MSQMTQPLNILIKIELELARFLMHWLNEFKNEKKDDVKVYFKIAKL